MVRSRPRSARLLGRASVLALVVAALATSAGSARDRGASARGIVIEELPHPSRQGFDEVIQQMLALRPSAGEFAAGRSPLVEDPSKPTPAASEVGSAPKAPAPVETEATAVQDAPAAARMEAPPSAVDAPGAPALLKPDVKTAAADTPAPTRPAAGEGAASPRAVAENEGAAEGLEATPATDLPPEAFKTPEVFLASPILEVQHAREAVVEGGRWTLRPTDAPQPIDVGLVSTPRVEPDSGPAPAPESAAASDRPAQAPPIDQPAIAAQNAAVASEAAPEPLRAWAAAAAPAPAQDTVSNVEKSYGEALARGVKGPVEVRLADRATLWLPAGRVFIAGEAAKELYADAPGAWDAAKLGIVVPTDAGWAAFVELIDNGYVKDEKGQGLEPAGVLAGLRRLAAQGNGDRRRGGDAPLALTGWIDPPRYDAKHRLSSCIGVTTQGSTNPEDHLVDCTAFALGRQGALKVQIVALEEDLAHFRNEAAALAGAIVYDHGKAYEDIDPADNAAPYDLSGLMTGGMSRQQTHPATPVNVAPKLGLLALIALKALKFWKILLIGASAVFSAFRWLRGKQKNAPVAVARNPAAEPAPAKPSLLAGVFASVKGRVAAGRGAASRREAAKPARVAEAAGPKAASRFSKAAAFLNAKLLRRDGGAARVAEPRPEAQTRAQAKAETAGSTLSRLASMMRKQEQGRDGAAASAPRFRNLGGGDFETTSSAERIRTLPGAAPMTGAAPITVGASFDLVEPGDQAAASAALSARRALRSATA